MKRFLGLYVIALAVTLCLFSPGVTKEPAPKVLRLPLEPGQSGKAGLLNGKVLQVIDDTSMLVGLEHASNGNSTYRFIVLIKCNTKGIIDDKFIPAGTWGEVTGRHGFKVLKDTFRYRTVTGATKTVLVLEPDG